MSGTTGIVSGTSGKGCETPGKVSEMSGKVFKLQEKCLESQGKCLKCKAQVRLLACLVKSQLLQGSHRQLSYTRDDVSKLKTQVPISSKIWRRHPWCKRVAVLEAMVCKIAVYMNHVFFSIVAPRIWPPRLELSYTRDDLSKFGMRYIGWHTSSKFGDVIIKARRLRN